jgi:hypothetical protein
MTNYYTKKENKLAARSFYITTIEWDKRKILEWNDEFLDLDDLDILIDDYDNEISKENLLTSFSSFK